MKVTFLGTGTSQGVPVIACGCGVCTSADEKDKRLRTSVLIEVDGKNFVIDTGPDFRQQMLNENVKHLDAVIFTHSHKDHVAGLDDIRAFNFKEDGTEMDVYATKEVQKALMREFFYIFEAEKYPGVPQISLHTIQNQPFVANGVTFTPVEVEHFRMPVFGFRIKDFTYITDANHIEPKELEKIKGSKVLVLNALRKTPHVSHFSLSEAIDLVKEVNPERAYFTHISHYMGAHQEVSKELPENVFLAHDGLSIEI